MPSGKAAVVTGSTSGIERAAVPARADASLPIDGGRMAP
jgi:NAD(P)-dependent dehydrogenase (short-subunit alcohol dehydrogenase family)